jgi:hypothetical protein
MLDTYTIINQYAVDWNSTSIFFCASSKLSLDTGQSQARHPFTLLYPLPRPFPSFISFIPPPSRPLSSQTSETPPPANCLLTPDPPLPNAATSRRLPRAHHLHIPLSAIRHPPLRRDLPLHQCHVPLILFRQRRVVAALGRSPGWGGPRGRRLGAGVPGCAFEGRMGGWGLLYWCCAGVVLVAGGGGVKLCCGLVLCWACCCAGLVVALRLDLRIETWGNRV